MLQIVLHPVLLHAWLQGALSCHCYICYLLPVLLSLPQPVLLMCYMDLWY